MCDEPIQDKGSAEARRTDEVRRSLQKAQSRSRLLEPIVNPPTLLP